MSSLEVTRTRLAAAAVLHEFLHPFENLPNERVHV